ncbi:retron Ec78 anti-phage system effector HNH endonuclease PtuB [Rahnella inusitata]|uniref:retron Ec78 anti-phage system effector HNH endonuclease PtuB n=1 Tax=Rahnella inusitata TaxID=58169 RepID=UPI0039BE08F1
MHKLNRGQKPVILDDFDHEVHNWNTHFKSHHKSLVWDKLLLMQGKRCAYCECTLDLSDPEETHIEHFRQKGKAEYKHLTFEWTNLFGSCCYGERCGRYKDKSGISSEEIIKMDEEDPDAYFQFMSTGSIRIKNDISEVEKVRATNTLKAFNLNPSRGGVKNDRKRIIDTHEFIIKEMLSCMDEFKDDADLELLIEIRDEYIEKIADRPFVTAIKHVLISRWEQNK